VDLVGTAGSSPRPGPPHRVIRICERQGVPILADGAYVGAGPWVTSAIRRPPNGELTPPERTLNRALATPRMPSIFETISLWLV
jgi:hypothetical protein